MARDWEWTEFSEIEHYLNYELFQTVNSKAWSGLLISAGYIVPRVEVLPGFVMRIVMKYLNPSMFSFQPIAKE